MIHRAGHEGAGIAFLLLIKVPELQEDGGKGRHRLAPDHHGHILPMAEPLIAVDVFIRQIDAAGKSAEAVDHRDLAVVPVVHLHRQMRLDGIEQLRLDAITPQRLAVIRRKRGDAAGIIIDEPHIHPFLYLILEDIQHAVPHDAFCDDEVL